MVDLIQLVNLLCDKVVTFLILKELVHLDDVGVVLYCAIKFVSLTGTHIQKALRPGH